MSVALGAAAAVGAAFQLTRTGTHEIPQVGEGPMRERTGKLDFRVETFLERLSIPWSLAFAPDGTVFFTERAGRIKIVPVGSLRSNVFAEVPIEHIGEGGLLGLTLSPDFVDDHYVYVYHTYREGSEILNRVVRYRDRNGVGVTSEVIFDSIPGGSVHDGGRLRFGPDRKLYVTTGEAGRSTLAQNLQSHGGKILRLNPDGTVPEDNPFPNSPVYSYGHRNPQGIDWHPVNGKLYETEHGPTGEDGRFANDEVNLIESGKNYGWPQVVCKTNDSRFVNPVYCTGDNETWAPSGCSFYKGRQLAEWRNSLFIATLRGTHLRRFMFDSQTGEIKVNEKLLEGTLGRLRDVVEGPDGLLYVLTNNRDGRGSPALNDDRIVRLVPTA